MVIGLIVLVGWLPPGTDMDSTEASDVAEALPAQGGPKRQRCQHKDAKRQQLAAVEAPFAVQSVVVTTDHVAQHTTRAQQLAAELSLDGELEAWDD